MPSEALAEPGRGASDVVRIRPPARWPSLNLPELWAYRDLIAILAGRDIRVRYKQTFVGVAWAVLQPLTLMVLFSLVFFLLGLPGFVNPVALYCGLVPWQLFAGSLTQSSESLVANQGLVSKVYFPRLVIPLAPILSNLVDFAIALAVLGGLMAWFRVTPHWPVALVPLFVLLTVLASLAVSLWISALNVLYRDFRILVPFLIQVGFFASPVVYETDQLHLGPLWRFVYSINPMVGVLEGFRWALLGKPAPPAGPMLVSIAAVALLLVGGLFYFRRMERLFADRI